MYLSDYLVFENPIRLYFFLLQELNIFISDKYKLNVQIYMFESNHIDRRWYDVFLSFKHVHVQPISCE